MLKKMILILGLLAALSVVLNSINVYKLINQSKEFESGKSMQNKALKQAKEIVEYIMAYSKTLPINLTYNEKTRLIKKEINKINFNKYQEKAYAFDSLGFYIAHYSKDYEKQNIFLEQDIQKRLYIKDLLNHNVNEGFTNASIFWTNHSIRHILTYVKKDETLNVYYGCTIDLDIFKNNKNNKKDLDYEIRFLLVNNFVMIVVILIFSFYQYRKWRKI